MTLISFRHDCHLYCRQFIREGRDYSQCSNNWCGLLKRKRPFWCIVFTIIELPLSSFFRSLGSSFYSGFKPSSLKGNTFVYLPDTKQSLFQSPASSCPLYWQNPSGKYLSPKLSCELWLMLLSFSNWTASPSLSMIFQSIFHCVVSEALSFIFALDTVYTFSIIVEEANFKKSSEDSL